MGVKLMVEVLDHAPADWTPSERLAVVAIAESIRDPHRQGAPPVELIAYRVGIDVASLSKTLRRLAAKGWELRVPTGVDKKGRTVYAHRGHRTVFAVPRLCPRGEHSTAGCARWATEDLGYELEAGEESPDHRPTIATQSDGERADHGPTIQTESPDHRPTIDHTSGDERADHRPTKEEERPDHRPLKAGPPSAPSPISPTNQSPTSAARTGEDASPTSDTRADLVASNSLCVATGDASADYQPGTPRSARRKAAKSAKKARKAPKPEPRRDDVERICQHLADRIVGNDSPRPTITETWRREARLLLDEKRPTPLTVEKVIALIDWCQDDPFWKSNIRGMPKFRAQYDALRLRALAEFEAAKRRGEQPNGSQAANGAIPVAERCPKPGHRGQRAGACRMCRADKLAASRRTA